MRSRRPLEIGLLAVVFSLAFSERVYAYLDPGTGAYLIQMLAAGAFAAAFMLKSQLASIRRKIRRWVKR